MTITTIVPNLTFPEGPRWHDDALWFSDMHDDVVLRVVPGHRPEAVAYVPGRPSGLGWTPEDELLVVSMLDRCVLSLADGNLVVHADLSGLTAADCNDMLTTPDGFSYVGNFGFDLHGRASPRPTVLFGIDRQGAVDVVADDLWFPNGMVLDPLNRRLIVAESYGHRLTAFDIAADGSLSGRRLWADLGRAGPDGIAVDAEGAIWVAGALDRSVLRVLEGGQIVERIAFPDRIPVACCLGGHDGRRLFVCSSLHLDPVKCRTARSARIDEIEVAVPAAR